MENLSDAQKDQVTTFNSITGLSDTDPSIAHLEKFRWNLERAVGAFFDGGLQRDEVFAEERHGGTVPRSSEPTEAPPPGSSGPLLPRSPLLEILDLLLLPFRLSYQLVSSLFGFASDLIFGPSVPNEFKDETPTASARRFKNLFENFYGNSHPEFYEGSYNSALEKAKRETKWMLAILYAPDHEATDSFCREFLASEETVAFLAASDVVVWAGDIRAPEGRKVMTALACQSHPFMAIIGPQSARMVIFDRIQGKMTAEQTMGKLQRAASKVQRKIEERKRERQSHQTSRSIRQEQDGAYEASLRADQEKAAKAQADREKAAKAKEEADRIAREKLTKAEMKEQRRKDIRESMKDEPLATDVGVTKLSLRFPSGSRLIRRFHSSDVIQSVYDFVDIQDLAPLPSEADFVLVNTYPRKIYSQMDQSLEEAGLVPTASLIVEERLPDAQ